MLHSTRNQDQGSHSSNSNRQENKPKSEISKPTYQLHKPTKSSTSHQFTPTSYSSQDARSSTSNHESKSNQKLSVKPSNSNQKMTSIKRTLRNDPLKRSSSSISLTSSLLTSIPSPPPSLGFLKASRLLQQQSSSLQSRMEEASGANSPLARLLRYWSSTGKPQHQILMSSIAVVILVKLSVSLGSYSGFSKGPLFGDLEAQRHWMGLTLHHWGLDYPPLTAYHSWILAHIGRIFNPIFVALRPPHPTSDDLTGWGDLHDSLKHFLRWTVLGSDLIIWIPVVFIYCFITYNTYQSDHSSSHASSRSISKSKAKSTNAIHSTLLLLLNPNLILIDNGHFQYNSIMLGLTLAAIVSFHLDRDLLGATLYVCSMCFKQMALYYSPAIFAYLFGKCLYLRHTTGLILFFKIAIVSITTLLVVFLPFIVFAPFPSTILQTIHRIFPLSRGLFEDKVANFWCAMNVIIKFRSLAEVSTLAKVALLMTLLAVLPGMIIVIWVNWNLGSEARNEESETEKPMMKKIPRSLSLVPLSLFNSSMAFYLFSFQVHEKTILLPILPLMMIISQEFHATNQFDLNTDGQWTGLISNVACFSMWPLLQKDNLHWQYVTLQVLYNYLIGYNPIKKLAQWSFIDYLTIISYVLIGLIHLSELMIKAPDRLPDLYIVMNLSLSFSIFGLSYLWSLHRLIEEGWGLIGFTKKPLNSNTRPTCTSSSSSTKLVSRSSSLSKGSKPQPVPSLHSRIDSISNPEIKFIEEEEEEEEISREGSKTKRATSLQARPKKPIHSLLSTNERGPIRSRSLGGTSLMNSQQIRTNLKLKTMISSPRADQLMNRIRNRVNAEQAVIGTTGSGSSYQLQQNRPQRMLVKEEGYGRRSSLGEEVEVEQIQANRGEEEVEGEEVEEGEEEVEGEEGVGEEEEGEGGEGEEEGEEGEEEEGGEEGEEEEGEEGEEEEEEEEIPIERIQTSREEEGEESMNDGERMSRKIEVVEQDWEMALRQSREGAIRRRREELRLQANLANASVTGGTGGGAGGGSRKLSMSMNMNLVGGYVDALDLVNGPPSRR
ncbi:family 57 glycosyltransferase [Melampsora larici-populina 98AG31]|uniref:dolichyl-P-Glc:Man9GlcNAc2-PP-dolichol alpha-1,3-glucosyltransferase n=1 Tax=Melampsora larici-populina (strain 98AG31 / pathotype 3-4-7) TaxID=747676 RepID=F4R3D8_MELLP|nr:family 57 glycosyltransferase [Melampsora larici-populina 98AG31]EGG12611.1 family 57 glycosyltransferase [Melampsora larici-populina 98AG31]